MLRQLSGNKRPLRRGTPLPVNGPGTPELPRRHIAPRPCSRAPVFPFTFLNYLMDVGLPWGEKGNVNAREPGSKFDLWVGRRIPRPPPSRVSVTETGRQCVDIN